MLRLKGLECLVSILKCMVEWSRDYYIDPATTGLNTVRVIRDAKGNIPEQLGANEGEEREVEEVGGRRFGSVHSVRSGISTGAEGTVLCPANELKGAHIIMLLLTCNILYHNFSYLLYRLRTLHKMAISNSFFIIVIQYCVNSGNTVTYVCTAVCVIGYEKGINLI